MISDSVINPVCKKCGGMVVYWDNDFVKQCGDKVVHDRRWTSNNVMPEDIDPNYVPKK